MKNHLSEALGRIARWLRGWLSGKPHVVIGEPDDPYLLRWYILPRNPWCNIYLHHFLRSDDDRALHDHPWASLSVLLWGRYIEHTPQGKKEYQAPAVIVRQATHTHRIELVDGRPCWTLFLTGRKVREWGFHCPQGFVPWRQFVQKTPGGNAVGKGCAP